MKRNLLAAAFGAATLLSGCMATEPTAINDVHTGVQAGVSREFVSSQGSAAIVRTQVVAGTAQGRQGFLVKVRRNASFSKNAFYNSAWSYGQPLNYVYGGATTIHCAPFGCDVMEWGSVELTPALFQQGLNQGLQMRLVGSHDSTVIDIPREAFQQAWAIAGR